LWNIILNTQGLKPTMILPNKAIKFVMNEMISKLVKPATRSAVNTKTILNMILCDCLNQEKLKPLNLIYKKLREEVKVVSLQIINERMKILQGFINQCVENEKSYIDLSHEEMPITACYSVFTGQHYQKQKAQSEQNAEELENKEKGDGDKKIEDKKTEDKKFDVKKTTGYISSYIHGWSSAKGQPKNERKENPVDKELELKLLMIGYSRHVITNYFKIVKKNLKANIIKSTLRMFVNYTKENLQNEFVKKMLHKENFESIMQEDTGFYKEHNKLVEKKKVLEKALETITRTENAQ